MWLLNGLVEGGNLAVLSHYGDVLEASDRHFTYLCATPVGYVVLDGLGAPVTVVDRDVGGDALVHFIIHTRNRYVRL